VYAVTQSEPNNAESFVDNGRTTCNDFPATDSAESRKIATEVEVMLHRAESPEREPAESLKRVDPVEPEVRPALPANPAKPADPVVKPRSIRAHGRSISREMASHRRHDDFCRRHASLPASFDWQASPGAQGKRHSIHVTVTSESHGATTVVSALLSDNDVVENVAAEDDARASTEIVYKLCQGSIFMKLHFGRKLSGQIYLL
jgi:hypothetical protein